MGMATLVGLSVVSTLLGVKGAIDQGNIAKRQANRDAATLERQRVENLRLAEQQISDIEREQSLADEQASRDLLSIAKFSAKELGSIKAQQGASGARGLSAQLVLAEAEQNRRIDELALRRGEEIDRESRNISIKRTREASAFTSRDSLASQRDTLSAGRDRAAAARLRIVGAVVGGASRVGSIRRSGLSGPTVKEKA